MTIGLNILKIGISAQKPAKPTVEFVSVNPSTMLFNSAGSQLSSNVQVTSSGAWTSAKINTGDGTTWFTTVPTEGSSGTNISGSCDTNFGSQRSAIVRVTCGTKTADITLTQYAA